MFAISRSRRLVALIALAGASVLTLSACAGDSGGNETSSGNREVDAQAKADGVTIPKTELNMGETGIFLHTDDTTTAKIDLTVTQVAEAPEGADFQGMPVDGTAYFIDYTVAAHDEAATALTETDLAFQFSMRDADGSLSAAPLVIGATGTEACSRPDTGTKLEVGTPLEACAIVVLKDGVTADAVSFRSNAGDYPIYQPVFWLM